MPTYDMKCINEECENKDVLVEIRCNYSDRHMQRCEMCKELMVIDVSNLKPALKGVG